MIPVTPQSEQYAQALRSAGCTKDQAARFFATDYVALNWAIPFHAAARQADSIDGPYWIVLGGARGPGKSHCVLAQLGLDDCQRVPGLKALYLRKLQRSAAESLEDLAHRVLGKTDYQYNTDRGQITFTNGSRIIVGGFKNATDIDKYIGLEYDTLAVEEVTQVTEAKLRELAGSIRTSKDNWRARVYASTNPGGPGHGYVKRNFVLPYRDGSINSHRFNGLPVRFFPATYRDNPFLSPEYRAYLESLQGPLGDAWRDGNWDSFEGMAFPDWDSSVHVVRPYDVPARWPRWRAVDWGKAKPWACLWLAKDPDAGRIIVYREAYKTDLTDTQQAKMIIEYTPPGEDIHITYADPSMWEEKTKDDEVFTTASEYADRGVPLTRANNDRIGGKRKVHRLLAKLPDGLQGLQVFSNCTHLIDQMANLPSDPNRPEDVDTDAEDHAYDALRYGLTNYEAHKPKRQQTSTMYDRETSKAMEALF